MSTQIPEQQHAAKEPGCLWHLSMTLLLAALTSPAFWLAYLSRTTLLTMCLTVLQTGLMEPTVELLTPASILKCRSVRGASFTAKRADGREVEGAVCCDSENRCEVVP